MDANMIIMILTVVIVIGILNFLWRVIRRAIASLLFIGIIILVILGITGNLNTNTEYIEQTIETISESVEE